MPTGEPLGNLESGLAAALTARPRGTRLRGAWARLARPRGGGA